MLKLHIANTFFEWELETHPSCPLSEGFLQHNIYRQLQFLPALYAAPDEGMFIVDSPEEKYWEKLQTLGIAPPQVFLLSESDFPASAEIESWGPSRLIAAFAKKHKLTYHMPDFELVRRVNSKQFSFENSPKLPHAALLYDDSQLKHWLRSFQGKKVLKTCYGVSGKGHLIIENDSMDEKRVSGFLQEQWKKSLPVIAEPWVDRVLDFSTQWSISKNQEINYLGCTICENDERGQYQSNTIGDEQKLFGSYLPFLYEHQTIVRPILTHIASLGFFGNLGIDTMLYKNSESIHLHPVVEINARKTMGWAALEFQKKHYPNQMIRFKFARAAEGYLPHSVTEKNGKTTFFQRNLAIDVYN